MMLGRIEQDNAVDWASAAGDFLTGKLANGSAGTYLVFMAAAAIVGIAIVGLDACIVASGGNSFLGLTHSLRTTPKVVLIWAVGPGFVAAFGLGLRIFEPTLQATILVAMTWRSFGRQLQALGQRDTEPQQKPDGG